MTWYTFFVIFLLLGGFLSLVSLGFMFSSVERRHTKEHGETLSAVGCTIGVYALVCWGLALFVFRALAEDDILWFFYRN